ncbi:MAG: penicillin-binding protein 1C, partial [Rubrivivax sp.]|nr:penicillin-binding protein 1C [Rubrivivax sp.]
FWSAVKTGTSKDMRDNWCVGFSDRFTVGVWVGNFDGSPMRDVSGVTGAAPVWLAIMSELHRGRPAQPPKAPAGVVTAEVRFTPAVEAARREYFLAGTETTEVPLPDRAGRQLARISYPGRGAILALDPDIPPGHERVFFEITPAGGDYVLRIDSETLVSAQAGWQPLPGRHRAELLDSHGVLLDQTEFEVRGAPPCCRDRPAPASGIASEY